MMNLQEANSTLQFLADPLICKVPSFWHEMTWTPRTDLDGSWRAILLLALNKLAFTSMGLWVFVLRRTVNIFFEACQ